MGRPLGYKIRHRDLRNCVALAEIGWRKLPRNPQYGIRGRCPMCMRAHPVRTYHLNVADDGTCNVSPKVFDNLCRAGLIDGVPDSQLAAPEGARPLGLPPFEYEARIEPPPLQIALGGKKPPVSDSEGRVLYVQGMRVVDMHDDYTE